MTKTELREIVKRGDCITVSDLAAVFKARRVLKVER